MNNILLLGAGQLGSRHLQGLAKITIVSKIFVVDPNLEALKIAEERYNEIEINPLIENIIFSTSFENLPQLLDLVIIATNSNIRAVVTKNILVRCEVKNILFEKFLFQKESDYSEISLLLKEKEIGAWVNCPRRLFDSSGLVKKLFSKNDSIFLSVTGGNWGLGCNSLHFIDLLAFITENYDFEFDSKYLSTKIFDSKRSGYKEFTGTLIGKQKNGSIIILNADPLYHGNSILTIRGNKAIAIIDEAMGKMDIATELTGWKWVSKSIGVKYQRQLTGDIAAEIISMNTCGLPTFEESVKLHIPILRTFLGFYNNIVNEKSDICPIT